MALQKNYNIKVYTLAGVYIRTLAPSVVMNGVSFTSQINGGQGEARIQLAIPFNTTLIAYNNIVKIFESDESNQTARQIYTGIVGSLQRLNDKWAEYIEVRAIGIASMLSWVYYDAAGAYEFSKSLEPAAILKDIIDRFTVKYPGLITYTSWASVENVGSTANLSFSYNKALDALKKTAWTTQYFWTIDAKWVLQFHPRTGGIGQVHHKLDIGKEVDTITVEEKLETLVNQYFLDYSGGSVNGSDATSQTAYGIRQLHESKTEITNNATATAAADAYIAKNKNPRKRVAMTVNTTYAALSFYYWDDDNIWSDSNTWTETGLGVTIENINPGDLVTVRNFEYDISALQIVKVEYNPDYVRLELEEAISFSEEIFS